MKKIQMVDVRSQYLKIKDEVDAGIMEVIDSCAFINGPKVKELQSNLEEYLSVKHVIPVANGTDALQIAVMALDLKVGDEIIVPAFTYAATAEVVGLLGLRPIMVDVDLSTFNVRIEDIQPHITSKTKAIIPVHLFGQTANMEEICEFAKEHNLYVIEDNAQAIGADCYFKDGSSKKSGTVGDIGCTSFYPSKNLGAYGDAGAIFTNDDELARKIRMIANHGQVSRYYHDVLGCNSRLDSIQAAILSVKLKHLDEFNLNRKKAAEFYDAHLSKIDQIELPYRSDDSNHVFHQYTLKVKDGRRNQLKEYLDECGIPSMIYYPVALYKQKAFSSYVSEDFSLPNTKILCDQVISLPMHSELTQEQQSFIVNKLEAFFKG